MVVRCTLSLSFHFILLFTILRTPQKQSFLMLYVPHKISNLMCRNIQSFSERTSFHLTRIISNFTKQTSEWSKCTNNKISFCGRGRGLNLMYNVKCPCWTIIYHTTLFCETSHAILLSTHCKFDSLL